MTHRRFLMDLKLSRQSVAADTFVRRLSPSDAHEMGQLIWLADQGGIHDEGQDEQAALKEVQQILSGDFGAFLPSCSLGIEDQGKLIACVLFTDFKQGNNPLLALTMTHPDHKGKGLCQSLLRHAVNALLDSGYTTCFLSVDERNEPARRAYEKVGFVRRAE